jgi:membrane-associated protein
MNQYLDWLIQHMSSLDPILRSVLTGIAIMAETSLFLGLVIPGDSVVLLASTGIANVAEFFLLIGTVLVGSMLGESLGFLIGRLFGPRIRSSSLGRKLSEKSWQTADAFVARRGGLAVGMSRFLPVLHSLVPVVSGMTQMTYRTFISWTTGACAIWASLYVSVGYIAKASYQHLADNLKFGGLIFVAILLLFLVVAHFGKKLLQKEANKLTAESSAEGNE